MKQKIIIIIILINSIICQLKSEPLQENGTAVTIDIDYVLVTYSPASRDSQTEPTRTNTDAYIITIYINNKSDHEIRILKKQFCEFGDNILGVGDNIIELFRDSNQGCEIKEPYSIVSIKPHSKYEYDHYDIMTNSQEVTLTIIYDTEDKDNNIKYGGKNYWIGLIKNKVTLPSAIEYLKQYKNSQMNRSVPQDIAPARMLEQKAPTK